MASDRRPVPSDQWRVARESWPVSRCVILFVFVGDGLACPESSRRAHPAPHLGSAGILPARKKFGALAGRMPALRAWSERFVWRANDEYETDCLHVLYFLYSENRVSLSVVVLSLNVLGAALPNQIFEAAVMYKDARNAPGHCSWQSRAGVKNDRRLRESLCLLRIADQFGTKVGAREDL